MVLGYLTVMAQTGGQMRAIGNALKEWELRDDLVLIEDHGNSQTGRKVTR